MDSQKGRQIHALAEQAREKGELIEALKLTEEAMANYVNDGDLLGAAEALSSKVLTLLRLHETTGKKEFLTLAELSALKSVEMAKNSGRPEAVALPLHMLGKVCEDEGKWPEAVDAHTKALEVMKKTPPERHNRPAYLAEIGSHLGMSKYISGDKEGLYDIDKAIETLENDKNEPKYNRDTWLSGSYMRKAKVLKEDNPAAAREALDKAKTIIDANPELTTRADQWQKLSSSF